MARTPSRPTSPEAGGEDDADEPGWLRRAVRGLTRGRGGRAATIYLRSTAVLAGLGLGLTVVVPTAGALVGFAIYTVWVTGPLSPLFPVGLEPVVMLLGRLYPPVVVAAVVTGAGLWVEYLSYHLYRTGLRHRAAREMRESDLVQRLRSWFDRRPFLTMWVLSWSPLPYWSGRILASLSGYSVPRYLTATFLGRFPKFWIFAALGVHWHIPAEILLGIVVVTTLGAASVWLWKR